MSFLDKIFANQKDRRDARHNARNERNYIKHTSRSERTEMRTNTRAIGYENGFAPGHNWAPAAASIGQSAAQAFSSIYGAGPNPTGHSWFGGGGSANPSQGQNKSQMMLILGAAALVLIMMFSPKR
jgi:hypothetical protein